MEEGAGALPGWVELTQVLHSACSAFPKLWVLFWAVSQGSVGPRVVELDSGAVPFPNSCVRGGFVALALWVHQCWTGFAQNTLLSSLDSFPEFGYAV